MLQKIMKVICFSGMYFVNLFLFIIYCVAFLPAKVAAKYQSVSILQIGLCEKETTNLHVILTAVFNDVLRPFEAEILIIFKNTLPQSQILIDSYRKKSVSPVPVSSLCAG